MKNEKEKKELYLFPFYFKKIGFVVLLFVIIAVILIKLMHIEFLHTKKDLYRIISLNAIILGLSFIVLSKDKIEDEMTNLIRLKSMYAAFLWILINVILNPFLNLLFKDPIDFVNGQTLVLNMLIFYLVIYNIQKISR